MVFIYIHILIQLSVFVRICTLYVGGTIYTPWSSSAPFSRAMRHYATISKPLAPPKAAQAAGITNMFWQKSASGTVNIFEITCYITTILLLYIANCYIHLQHEHRRSNTALVLTIVLLDEAVPSFCLQWGGLRKLVLRAGCFWMSSFV